MSGGKNLSFFGFFVSAMCVREKPKVLKGAVALRFVANVWRYAAQRIDITYFSAYKYIKLISVMFILTTNSAMQYERLLAAGRFFSVRQGGQTY